MKSLLAELNMRYFNSANRLKFYLTFGIKAFKFLQLLFLV
ncbi:hypothetical protein Buni01_03493 [Bacteroides uniformis]